MPFRKGIPLANGHVHQSSHLIPFLPLARPICIIQQQNTFGQEIERLIAREQKRAQIRKERSETTRRVGREEM